MITNALTIDVEDYFHLHAFSDVIRQEDWESFNARVENNTLRILDILDSSAPNPINPSNPSNPTNPITPSAPRATFFILGWMAERYPGLVRQIHEKGHEIACHGYAHKVIFKQTRDEFREDVKRAKGILEDYTGEEVVGYRAPTYSIIGETVWALEVLYDLGFKYDSSIFPIRHDFYGFPGTPRFAYMWDLGGDEPEIKPVDDLKSINFNGQSPAILEFPITTFRTCRKNIPVSGGGYFRLFPYFLTKSLLKRINGQETKPFVFYIHPWEIDPGIPRIDNARMLSRFRTYINLDKTESRFRQLLADFRFSSLSDLLTLIA